MTKTAQSTTPRPVIVEDGVIAGNYTDKYGSSNPLHRRLMRGFFDTLDELVAATESLDVHEVGCGEGHLSLHLAEHGLTVRGSDFSAQVIEQARANAERAAQPIPFTIASIYDLRAPEDAAELVVCCEVLEHLEDPHRAVEILATLARPWLIVSVPREPLWRALNMARGKYVRDLGNTPGHLSHFSKRGLHRLLSPHVDVVELRTPLPWTFALCRSRNSHDN